MNDRASVEQIELARRWLEREGAHAADCATAAGRIYDALQSQLSPLMGAAGFQALLARSAKLTRRQFDFLDVAEAIDSTRLRQCLQAQDPTLASAAAAVLFGTFIALITTFIGERLTSQVLRSSWPTLPALPALPAVPTIPALPTSDEPRKPSP